MKILILFLGVSIIFLSGCSIIVLGAGTLLSLIIIVSKVDFGVV